MLHQAVVDRGSGFDPLPEPPVVHASTSAAHDPMLIAEIPYAHVVTLLIFASVRLSPAQCKQWCFGRMNSPFAGCQFQQTTESIPRYSALKLVLGV